MATGTAVNHATWQLISDVNQSRTLIDDDYSNIMMPSPLKVGQCRNQARATVFSRHCEVLLWRPPHGQLLPSNPTTLADDPLAVFGAESCETNRA